MHTRISNPDLQLSDEIHNEALILIEDMCLIILNKVLPQSGMTAPNRPMQDLKRVKQYDVDALK